MKQLRYLKGLTALLLSVTLCSVQAQDKTEKSKVKVDLTYNQQNDELPVLKITTKTKKGKKFEAVDSVDVNLYFNEETTNGFIGRVKTNSKGTALLKLPLRLEKIWASTSDYKFIASLTGSDRYEDASAEIEIAKAKIELTLEEKDSVRSIHATLLAFKDSSWVAVPETEMKLVVRRLLADLKAGEEDSYTTDENGVASAEFSMTIPGDKDGNIFVGAKIEDNELYGNVVATKMVKWGTPLPADDSFSKRSLWATRDKTPLWLLIFPNLIITGVWGIIFYLLFQIVKIIKLGKTKESI